MGQTEIARNELVVVVDAPVLDGDHVLVRATLKWRECSHFAL